MSLPFSKKSFIINTLLEVNVLHNFSFLDKAKKVDHKRWFLLGIYIGYYVAFVHGRYACLAFVECFEIIKTVTNGNRNII